MSTRLAAAAALVVALAFVVSCATSSGNLIDLVRDAEEAEEGGDPADPPDPPEELEGLEIRSDPAGAAVWINNRYQGTTPLVVDDLPAGTYRVLLVLEGYHEDLAWLDYPGGPYRYRVSLSPVMGFVKVDVTPRGARVLLDGRQVSAGITPLPVGSYHVEVNAFGYAPWNGRVEVWEEVVSDITVDLEPTPFDLTGVAIGRPVVNPRNPGLLGGVELDFAVTGPGTGTVTVLDASRRAVHRYDLPPFTDWAQRWRWQPPDDLPDGGYSLVVEATGNDGRSTRDEAFFSIDRTHRIAARANWSGGAGLLYAPVAETLPARSWQAAFTGLAFVDPDGGALQAPVLVSLRSGLGAGIELDASVGAILTGATPPLTGSISLRWQALAPSLPAGVGVAIEAKAALQGVPGGGMLTTDTFANFSGLGLGVPLQVSAGPVSLLLEPAVLFSAWRVDYFSDPVTSPSPAAWMYWRAGLLFDAGPVVAGVSASARSAPLPGGLLAIELPVQAAGEIHWLLPDTHVLVGAAVAGEFAAPDNWYLMGGISLGVLF